MSVDLYIYAQMIVLLFDSFLLVILSCEVVVSHLELCEFCYQVKDTS